MKRLLSLMLMLCLCGAFGVTAYATGEQPNTAITDTDTTTPGDAITVEQAVGADDVARPPAILIHVPSIQPTEVKMEMLGDVPYITKTYEIAEDDADDPIRSLDSCHTFEQDGYQFTRCDTISHTLAGTTETRTEVKTETIALEKEDAALVLAQAEPYFSYDEGGFTGRLLLDEGSIHITETGRENYGYRVTDVREYDNLDRQDAAYIPKTVLKNGVELGLESVEWVVMGQTPTADGMVPNLFKAIATYTGGATGSRVSGYTATFRYTGTVEKIMPGVIVYQAVFRGEKIALPEPEPEKSVPMLPILAGVLAVMALAAGGVVFFKRRAKTAVPAPAARTVHAQTRDYDMDALRQNAEAGYDGNIYEKENNIREDDDEENLAEDTGYAYDGEYYDGEEDDE